MKTKLVSISIAILLLLSLAGCGSDTDNGGTTAKTTKSATTEPTTRADTDKETTTEEATVVQLEPDAAVAAYAELAYIELVGQKVYLPCTLQELLDVGYTVTSYHKDDLEEKLVFAPDGFLYIDLLAPDGTSLDVMFTNPTDEEISVYDAVTRSVGADWKFYTEKENFEKYYPGTTLCGVTPAQSHEALKQSYMVFPSFSESSLSRDFSISVSEQTINGYYVYFSSLQIDVIKDDDVEKVSISFAFEPF